MLPYQVRNFYRNHVFMKCEQPCTTYCSINHLFVLSFIYFVGLYVYMYFHLIIDSSDQIISWLTFHLWGHFEKLRINLRACPYQPCTQRNIFGSHWLLSVQTLVARANMNFSENKYHTLQILLVSTEALFTSFSTIHMPHHHHHLCSA